MIVYITNRVLQGLVVLVGVSFIVFALMHLTPGNPAEVMLSEFGASAEDLRRLRDQLGIDQHWTLQYRDFLAGAVRGDLGRSLFTRRPVAEQIISALPSTLALTSSAIGIALVVGMPLGIVSALRHRTWIDSVSMVMSLLGVAMPVFWIAILLILIFSINLGWFPATGGVGAGSMVLPAVALGLGAAGLIARLVRSSMLEVLRAEYIVTARSKGLREAPVIVRHALRNALIPLVTIVGLQIGNLLSGAVVVETVFARQGIGSMLIKGIVQKDFPLVQGLILFIAVVYIGINIAIDILYGVIDPRVRTGAGGR
ncbi:MAG: binding-protein-dependent transport system inner rane component [Thermomicrobiales bacterium]|nr:binding-protein-dependent transport system inner rane component [Thermomicrobiales bacterium]MDF3014851.1 binding-protein-dependent transport system inner rane component [Thermomicrobiales bacterium]